jgi:NADH-quinone oxidoreductase subunit L
MSRLFFMTFHGQRRWTEDVHPHESPRVMTIPMIILAVGAGGLGAVLSWNQMFVHWLEPVVGHQEGETVIPLWSIIGLTLLLVVGGAALAWARYWRDAVPQVAPAGSLLTRAARQDLYQDEVNEGVLMRPGIHLTRALVFADNRGIDGGVGGLAALIGGTSSRLRRLQNGFARSYALTMLAGVVVILGALWVIQ